MNSLIKFKFKNIKKLKQAFNIFKNQETVAKFGDKFEFIIFI